MLLDRVSEVFLRPFPHIVIENALEDSFYNDLVRTQPSPSEIILNRPYSPNQRIDLKTGLAISGLHSVWREFIQYHIGNEFVEKARKVFGIVDKIFPRCQPGVNTPSPVLSKVRGPHLDNPTDAYASLFYMAQDDDGGNLELYEWNDKPKRFYGKLEVGEECVRLVKTIPYKPNTYVMFLNTERSLHGVTPRKSVKFRRLVNVVGDTDRPLFKIGHNGY